MFEKLQRFRFALLILLVYLGGCVNKGPTSDKIFSNAQVLYQVKDKESLSKRAEVEKASYFVELNYEPGQTVLSKGQIQKVDAVFKKLIYPEEYKLYVSFGGVIENNQMVGLAPMLKRAQDIKNKYGKKVSGIQIAYLKNQNPNVAIIRLMA